MQFRIPYCCIAELGRAHSQNKGRRRRGSEWQARSQESGFIDHILVTSSFTLSESKRQQPPIRPPASSTPLHRLVRLVVCALGTPLQCPLEPVRHMASSLAGFCRQRSSASYTETDAVLSSTVTDTATLTCAPRIPAAGCARRRRRNWSGPRPVAAGPGVTLIQSTNRLL